MGPVAGDWCRLCVARKADVVSGLPTCDVVIVNWNAGALIARCVGSLAATARTRFAFGNVVVVDNASSDGSVEFPPPPGLPFAVLRNPGNDGFARACNRGARAGAGSHVLFLNPDTVVPEDCLDRLFAWLAGHPEHAGSIVGIRLYDAAGRTSVTCSRFPSLRGIAAKVLGLEGAVAERGWSQPMLEFDHASSRVVDQVIGAFFLVPRPLFEALGGFAEKYFLYFEEVDFCRRAARRGHVAVFCAEACATHVGGASSGRVPAHRLALSLHSRLIYCRDAFGTPAFAAAAVLTLVAEPLARLVRAVATGRVAAVSETLHGFVLLYRGLLTGAPAVPR
ncbi:MAG: glycosyltransferase family 2 protein [Alphaproteobacteria bacterium]|nr:glycosyltransferase family 2 protein [Alphaproteobacteria bacterium]